MVGNLCEDCAGRPTAPQDCSQYQHSVLASGSSTETKAMDALRVVIQSFASERIEELYDEAERIEAVARNLDHSYALSMGLKNLQV